MVKFQSLAQFPQWVTFPTQLDLVFHFVLVCYIHLSLFYSFQVFHTALADCLSLESEWHQVSRTLLNIPSDFNNAVVWMVSIHPPISKSSCFLSESLRTVLSMLIHRFLSSLARSKYLSLVSLSMIFHSVVHWDSSINHHYYLFLFLLFQ